MRDAHLRGRLARFGLSAAIALVLGPWLSPVTAAFASGSDFYVTATGTNNPACSQASPCATISAAIAAAGSGGTIHVGPGTFADNLDIQSGAYVILGVPDETTFTSAADEDLITLGGSASLTIDDFAIDYPYSGYVIYQTGGTFSLYDSSMKGGEWGLSEVGGSATLSDDMITGITALPVDLVSGNGPLAVTDSTIEGGDYGVSQESGQGAIA